MIVLRNVTKIYLADGRSPVAAVCDANLAVGDRDFIVIHGPSGSGKTTLLNVMAGLTLPTSGQVLYDGVEIWRLPDRQHVDFRNRHVGFIFQFPSLMPSLTILENVLSPTTFAAGGEDAGERTRRAMDLLRDVGLSDVIGAYPRQLPAGHQQRVVIARALVNRPAVLFADEPTFELDEGTACEIMSLLQDLHRRLGVTVVLATQERRLAQFGTRTLEMTAGQLVGRTALRMRTGDNLTPPRSTSSRPG